MQYEVIIFDLDGTLCDSFVGIQNGWRYTMDKMGLPIGSDAEIRSLIGPPLHTALTYYFDDPAQVDVAIAHYRDYYNTTGLFEGELYAGIRELLEALAVRATLYVVTNKPKVTAVRVLENFQVAHLFSGIWGPDFGDTDFEKAPCIVAATQPHAGKRALMVGDRLHDVTGGKKAGIHTAGVLYGYGTRAELEALVPDHLVETVADLHALLAFSPVEG